jgi:CRISPR-associated protein Cmr4
MQYRQKILYIFTRTPLHVGAGSSVSAIDQPIQRERHTAFPIIPASSLKGTFADAWNDRLIQQENKKTRITVRKEGEKTAVEEATEAAWLFGSDDANHSFAGSLQFSEAKLLAFPVRSAKGSFAWITSPLILRRAARDGVLDSAKVPAREPSDDEVMVCTGSTVVLQTNQIVLEEYAFKTVEGDAKKVGEALAGLLKDKNGGDPIWKEVSSRLVILSDGMMSFFAQNACEVAQHVRITDVTGTAEPGGLFNQENVPSETFFYAVVHATDSRLNWKDYADKSADSALAAFSAKLDQMKAFQFGGDASMGLGYCTVKLAN